MGDKHGRPQLFWKGGGGEEGGGADHFQPIQPVGGGGRLLSAFGPFNQWGEGGCCPRGEGGAVRLWPIQLVGGRGGSADVSFRPIQSMSCPRFQQIQPVGDGCCPLSANSASGGCACV